MISMMKVMALAVLVFVFGGLWVSSVVVAETLWISMGWLAISYSRIEGEL